MKTASLLVIFLCAFLLIGISEAAQRGGQWQLLGEQEVDFKNDRDRIDVKRKSGPYRELRIEVRDAPIEVNEMIVTFGDGKTFSPKSKRVFVKAEVAT
jgi:hypothetical protein